MARLGMPSAPRRDSRIEAFWASCSCGPPGPLPSPRLASPRNPGQNAPLDGSQGRVTEDHACTRAAPVGFQEGTQRTPWGVQEGPRAGFPAVKLAALVLDSRGAPLGALVAPSWGSIGSSPSPSWHPLGAPGEPPKSPGRAPRRVQEEPQAGFLAVKLAALVLDSRGAPLGAPLAPSWSSIGSSPNLSWLPLEARRHFCNAGPSSSSSPRPAPSRPPPASCSCIICPSAGARTRRPRGVGTCRGSAL